MRRGSYTAVFATFAALALVVAVGSAAAASSTSRPAVKDRAVGARSLSGAVVRQVGPRNYAGPNCPGVSWNCTKATRVVQISTAATGVNSASCTTPAVTTPTSQSCSATQTGASNNYSCQLRMDVVPTTTQTCDVTQTGANNNLTVAMGIQQIGGATQTAIQKATLTQGPGATDTTATNNVKLVQWVKQTTGNTTVVPTQSQDAYQSLVLTQTAKGSGTNTTDLHQWQFQTESNGTIQNQNATGSLPAEFTDCAPTHGPTTPNSCANISQSAQSGTNKNVLEQFMNEDEKSSAVATQTQGTTSGGHDGLVHQDSSTSSTNQVTQKKNHTQTGAAGSDQGAHDPISCCGFFSIVGPGTDTINQSATLSANANYSQTADLTGESTAPSGSCFISHDVIENDASISRDEGQSPCDFMQLDTFCGSSDDEGGCSSDLETEPPCTECSLDGFDSFTNPAFRFD